MVCFILECSACKRFLSIRFYHLDHFEFMSISCSSIVAQGTNLVKTVKTSWDMLAWSPKMFTMITYISSLLSRCKLVWLRYIDNNTIYSPPVCLIYQHFYLQYYEQKFFLATDKKYSNSSHLLRVRSLLIIKILIMLSDM